MAESGGVEGRNPEERRSKGRNPEAERRSRGRSPKERRSSEERRSPEAEGPKESKGRDGTRKMKKMLNKLDFVIIVLRKIKKIKTKVI